MRRFEAPESAPLLEHGRTLCGNFWAVENLNINPNNPGLQASYSVYLAKLGRAADAIKELSSATSSLKLAACLYT